MESVNKRERKGILSGQTKACESSGWIGARYDQYDGAIIIVAASGTIKSVP